MPIHVFLYAHARTCANMRNHTHNISKRNMKWNRSLCSSLCLLNTTDSALGNKHVCLTDKGLNTTNTCPSFKELTSAKMKEKVCVCVRAHMCTCAHVCTSVHICMQPIGQPWVNLEYCSLGTVCPPCCFTEPGTHKSGLGWQASPEDPLASTTHPILHPNYHIQLFS